MPWNRIFGGEKMKLLNYIGLLIIILTAIGGILGAYGIIFPDWGFWSGFWVFTFFMGVGLILFLIDLEVPIELEED